MAATPEPPSSRALALVTGASAGIGYELARQFARHGYDLVAAGRSEGIEQAAADLSENGAQRSSRFARIWPATTAWKPSGRPYWTPAARWKPPR